MIRECEDHGYFRADICPICGEEGKFIVSDKEIERIGRTLAAILRHGKFEPDMDDQGFVPIQEVVSLIRARHTYMNWLRPRHIEALAETDPKGRYQFSNGKVRATYGHTIPLDLRLDNSDVPPELFYPVSPEEAEDILCDGISPTDRNMVHLSLTYRDALRAGSVRMDDPLVVVIDTGMCVEMGSDIGKAAKTVFLCRHVPSDAITIADPEDWDTGADDEEEAD
ncbi:RNA 2'-phosphotransferase [Candidatus Methanoprimaticola sp. MG2]|uniref:RNA 2'-phosphotransferase n=1 Tax=Candidatus Methanoprimaticola sp. MG2 TaxID=3228838 RepID=UPI0039C6EDA0